MYEHYSREGLRQANRRLRILITTTALEERTGGAMYVHDLALTLLGLGHVPVVFSTRSGPVADILRRRTVPVIECLNQLTTALDLIHGNSPIETVAALLAFPNTPAIFTCHGWDSPDAAPPHFRRIVRYIAVDETCRDRLTCRESIPEDKVLVEFNSVDLARFVRRPSLPRRPRRALVFSNYAADSNYLPAIRTACAREEIDLDVAGEAFGALQTTPEQMLVHYDIVFAKARCALESLAVGNAVVLCDTVGLGPMVTSQNVRQLRAMNFGWRTLQESHHPDQIQREIRSYNADDAGSVCDAIRDSEGLQAAAERMVGIYAAAIRLYRESASEGIDEERLSISRFLESIAPFSNTQYIRRREIAAAQNAREESEAIRAFVKAIPMPRLDAGEQRELGLSDGFAPPVIQMSDGFSAIVDVHNGTSRLVSSQLPYPVNISYHWITPGGHIAVAEGLRTKLLPPIAPGERRKYRARIEPPNAPGEWILRVTLVQESVLWFDDHGLQCFVDLPVTVL